ncbi:MAG: chemotaxis protein CheW [Deltaproteobacteria bacterium]|nr:chemotaxis protein CheW [Deltaproteobacteria bacterium]
MDNARNSRKGGKSEYATFFLKNALCGIALSSIQEISKPSRLTVVHQSPDYVMGVINLRGKIVTIIDTGKLLGLTPIKRSDDMRNIIVNLDEEFVGLMVDRIGNVITVEPAQADMPPANIGDVPGRCFDAVYKTNNEVVGLLSLDSIF